MKSTDHFKRTIEQHLNQVAIQDPLFAQTLKKENKNIDDCITYIFNQVKNSGCNGFEDDEIFGMAIHYYDEDTIEVGGKLNMKVVTNHTVHLTEEEKAEAKKEALEKLVAEEQKRLQTKSIKKGNSQQQSSTETLTLF